MSTEESDFERGELFDLVVTSEYLWHGGLRGPQKIWDPGTANHVEREVRGGSADSASLRPSENARVCYRVIVECEGGEWSVRYEEA